MDAAIQPSVSDQYWVAMMRAKGMSSTPPAMSTRFPVSTTPRSARSSPTVCTLGRRSNWPRKWKSRYQQRDAKEMPEYQPLIHLPLPLEVVDRGLSRDMFTYVHQLRLEKRTLAKHAPPHQAPAGGAGVGTLFARWRMIAAKTIHAAT